MAEFHEVYFIRFVDAGESWLHDSYDTYDEAVAAALDSAEQDHRIYQFSIEKYFIRTLKTE